MPNYYFLEIKLFDCAYIMEAKIIPRIFSTRTYMRKEAN